MIIYRDKYSSYNLQFRHIDLNLYVKRREAQPYHENLEQSWLVSNTKMGNVFELRQMKSLLIQTWAILMNFSPSLSRNSGVIQTAVTFLKIFQRARHRDKAK